MQISALFQIQRFYVAGNGLAWDEKNLNQVVILLQTNIFK